MISRLYLDNFKCFAEQELRLAPLTILSGANASGKTSVLQSLLLLRQSYDAGCLHRGELLLSGDLISVGVARDVFAATAKTAQMILEVEDSLGVCERFKFAYESGQGDAYVLSPPGTMPEQGDYRRTPFRHPNPSPGGLQLRECESDSGCMSTLFRSPFAYVCAERVGPRLTYPMDSRSSRLRNVGTAGQYWASCLATYGDDPLPNLALEYPGSRQEGQISLTRQLQLWMRQIVPELELEVERLVRTDEVRIGLRNQGNMTDYLRPTNIGFGISYVLAVVVAVLVAKPDSVLLLENPEAHLHPFGQSQLGNFLARAAAAGLQLLVETHSDHLLNGARVAVKHKHLLPDQTAIHFFSAPSGDDPRVQSPCIDKDGRIDRWPRGFFDQAEQDLLELL